MRRDLRPEILAPKMSIFASSWRQRMTRWYHHGTMFDRNDWYRRVMWFTCGYMTFEEAYKKTGRVLCVTLSATSKKAPPVLINYITAPNVVIASAVLASAAVPGFVDAVRLQVKDESGVVRDQSKCDEASTSMSFKFVLLVSIVSLIYSPFLMPAVFPDQRNIATAALTATYQQMAWRKCSTADSF